MTDTRYKSIFDVPTFRHHPKANNVTAFQPLVPHWFHNAMGAQDHVPGLGFRTIATQHMGGSDEWLVGSTTPVTGATPDYPADDDNRTILSTHAELTPGCFLALQVLYVPAGATEFLSASLFHYGGGFGQVRLQVIWDNGKDVLDLTINEQAMNVSLAGGPTGFNQEFFGFQTQWSQIRYALIPFISPDGILPPGELVKWSEFPTVQMNIQHVGGARVIHSTLYEIPRTHAVHNLNDFSTYHDVPSLFNHPNAFPQISQQSGSNFDENRFGTHKLIDVAARQHEKLGPHICDWSSYSEEAAEVTDSIVDPFTTTSDTFVGLIDQGLTFWSGSHPGFAVPGHYARRYKENGGSGSLNIILRDVAGVIPVTIRAIAKMGSGNPNAQGEIKFQVSERSSVTMLIDSGTIYTIHHANGFLESTRNPQDNDMEEIPNMIPFFRSLDGSTELDVQHFSVNYGDIKLAQFYNGPKITDVNPSLISSYPATIRITGSNFQSNDEFELSGLKPFTSSSLTFIDETHFEFSIDSGQSGSYDIRVRRADDSEKFHIKTSTFNKI